MNLPAPDSPELSSMLLSQVSNSCLGLQLGFSLFVPRGHHHLIAVNKKGSETLSSLNFSFRSSSLEKYCCLLITSQTQVSFDMNSDSQNLISKAQFTFGLKFIKCLILSANQHFHLLKIKRKNRRSSSIKQTMITYF